MCDDAIHPGLVEDWRVTRRTLVGGLAASLAAGTVDAAGAGVVERDVTVATPDGQADAVVFRPAGPKRHPAVLMWPDIMGLRPVFRAMARRLAAEGYVVLVPNPFYRSARAPVVKGRFDFGDPAVRARLMGYRSKITPDGARADSAAFLQFLDALPAPTRAGTAAALRIASAPPMQ